QCEYLCGVEQGQVFQFPAAANRRSFKVTLIPNQVALNSFHSGGDDPIGKIIDAFEVVAVIEPRRDRWISCSPNAQKVAYHATLIWFFFRINRSDEMKIRSEAIERGGYCV